jgi:hypothetical protein
MQVWFDISKATLELLKRSAAMSDMDEALIAIQSARGIETGDLAGLFSVESSGQKPRALTDPGVQIASAGFPKTGVATRVTYLE